MKVCKTWAVAAVYFLQENKIIAHYKNEITPFVESSGLTRLGTIGKTTHQTVGSSLREETEVFYMDGDGYYGLVDADLIKEHPDVLQVYEMLELKEKIRNLKEHIGLVEQEISRVKQLCDEIL